MNNKMIKGSVAGATGIVLLMGGFGTYALWSDSEDLASNGVSSGVLTIDTSTGWYDDASNTAGTPETPDWVAGDLMVPGDTVTYTQVFTVSGTGKNLEGTVTLDVQDLDSDFTTLVYDVDVVASGDGATDITKDSPTSFSFEDPFGTATLTATVTYTFPAGDENLGTTDQGASATTPISTFTISQS
jgi:alternate signal-mediated exported protein